MPTHVVRADYETLAEIAQGFDREAESTRRTLDRLHRDLDVLLDGDWRGRGAEEFYREMITSVLPSVKRLADALGQAARATAQISRLMKQAEDDAAALFKIDWVERYRQSGQGGEPDLPGPIDDWIRAFIHWVQQQLMPPPGYSPIRPTTPAPPTQTLTQTPPPQTPPAPTEAPPPAATPLPPTAEPTQAATGGTMYTTDWGVNVREDPDALSTSRGMLPAGTPLQLLSETPVQGGDHMWYQVLFEGEPGWVAAEYLSDTAPSGGSPAQASVDSGLGFVNGPYVSGSTWLDTTLGLDSTHYGVDIASNTGDNTLYAPYTGRVVVYDSCASCPEGDGNTTALGKERADLKYNYGFGAMSIVEYSYSDLTEAQRAVLSERGFDLQPGQSLYLMNAHQDRSGNNAASDTQLKAGDAIAAMGNSGNSGGGHFHIEAAINDSGLSPADGENTAEFWLDTIAEYDYVTDKQGKRIDPTSLFVETP